MKRLITMLCMLTCLVLAAPPAATGATTNFNDYRYGACGDFKSGVRAYVYHSQSTTKNSSTYATFNGSTHQANSFTCSDNRPNAITRIALGQRMRWTGTDITSCTVNLPPGASCTWSKADVNLTLPSASRSNNSSLTYQYSGPVQIGRGNFSGVIEETTGTFTSGGYVRSYALQTIGSLR